MATDAPKKIWLRVRAGRRGRVGHHVERVQDEGHAAHRHQRAAERACRTPSAARSACSTKRAQPGQNQRQALREARVEKRAGADDDRRAAPSRRSPARFSVKWYGGAMPTQGNKQQRDRDAEVRRVVKVPHAVADLHAQQMLRRDADGGGQGDRAEPLVGIQQHRAGQAGDVGRQEEIDERHDAAAEETRAALVRADTRPAPPQLPSSRRPPSRRAAGATIARSRARSGRGC